jgi:8-oxo-dGTP pyrophosphatase MutT (NUDIX family)
MAEQNLRSADMAAVLVPVYRAPSGEIRVVLIRRAERGRHAGQIAFPGGRSDPEDRTPIETALREAEEEIGLERERVEVLATFPEIETRASGFVIVPVLGRIRRPEEWRPDPREVAEILEVPVASLALPESRGEALDLVAGWTPPQPLPFYRIESHRLWGATFRILEPLIPRLLADEWPV